MDDLAPSAVTRTAAWEKTPSQEERKGRRHRPPEKPREEEPEDLDENEPHILDELA